MGTVLLCLALNIAAFFYLHAWRPVVDLWKWMRLSRQIKAMRVAGLMLLLCAVGAPARAHAQNVTDVSKTRYFTTAQGWSDGDDALVAKYQHDVQETTGYPALDDAIRYVWNNCGKLMVVFLLLAAVSMLRSKMESQETYGDVLRREAAERWEEETTTASTTHLIRPRACSRLRSTCLCVRDVSPRIR